MKRKKTFRYGEHVTIKSRIEGEIMGRGRVVHDLDDGESICVAMELPGNVSRQYVPCSFVVSNCAHCKRMRIEHAGPEFKLCLFSPTTWKKQ